MNLLTKSDVTATQINNYIAAKNSTSPLNGLGQFFLAEQDTYGINALYLFAHAIHETGNGTSPLAKLKHNYFGLGAYDSYPFTNAYYFKDVQNSVDFEANFVICEYLEDPSSHPGCGKTMKAPHCPI